MERLGYRKNKIRRRTEYGEKQSGPAKRSDGPDLYPCKFTVFYSSTSTSVL